VAANSAAANGSILEAVEVLCDDAVQARVSNSDKAVDRTLPARCTAFERAVQQQEAPTWLPMSALAVCANCQARQPSRMVL
jgi:hypothetical protein